MDRNQILLIMSFCLSDLATIKANPQQMKDDIYYYTLRADEDKPCLAEMLL